MTLAEPVKVPDAPVTLAVTVALPLPLLGAVYCPLGAFADQFTGPEAIALPNWSRT